MVSNLLAGYSQTHSWYLFKIHSIIIMSLLSLLLLLVFVFSFFHLTEGLFNLLLIILWRLTNVWINVWIFSKNKCFAWLISNGFFPISLTFAIFLFSFLLLSWFTWKFSFNYLHSISIVSSSLWFYLGYGPDSSLIFKKT